MEFLHAIGIEGVTLILTLLCLMLICLWPFSDQNLYQRQRQFSRIDQIFFPTTVQILSDLQSREFLNAFLKEKVSFQYRTELAFSATLVSLSLGGCSLVFDRPLSKGTVGLLHLDSLPDFPKTGHIITFKVVWVREVVEGDGTRLHHGCKFLSLSQTDTHQKIKDYIHLLLEQTLV